MDRNIRHESNGKRRIAAILLVLLVALTCTVRAESTGREKDHPCIRITTEGGQPILSRKEYVPAEIRVFNCDAEDELTAEGGIRVRGNSTAEQGDEKPYRIKFTEKQNLLGLHEGRKYKSWVLLRAYENLATDYMAFHLAKAIFEGAYYSSDSCYINLYINDVYRGIYVLCEQSQAAKGRIDIYEPHEDETGIEIGYLLEMDNYPDAEAHPFFEIPSLSAVTDIAGTKRILPYRAYSIKSDTASQAQKTFIRKHLSGVFRILYEAAENGCPMMLSEDQQAVPAEGVYETPLEAVSAVIDLESLANMLILEELIQNYDVGMGSFFMAVDFSPESLYRKLTFLSPWDSSWAYSEPPDGGYYASTFQNRLQGYDPSNPWYILAMKIDGFREIVREKWRRLAESGVLEKTIRRVEEDFEALSGDLGQEGSARIELARGIADYVRARIEWLNGQWTGAQERN